jgi:hypothetical protein
MTIMAVLLGAGVAAPAMSADLTDIPLRWKPTDTISSLDAIDMTAFQHVTFAIKPFNDLRKRPEEIGKNVEKRLTDRVRLVTTKDDVALWLTDHFGQVLKEFDIDVVKSNSTVTLEADVVKFYVTEESQYKADVGLKVRLRSKSGDVLWEGMVSASSSQWGSSYKADNYYEALSNATISAVYALLKNDAFRQAVQKGR